jgi:hypothetical protein
MEGVDELLAEFLNNFNYWMTQVSTRQMFVGY